MSDRRNDQNKLQPTDTPIDEFLDGIEHPRRQSDARELVELLREITGEEAEVWTYGIIGFGRHHYRHNSGREGETGTLGFAPRKSNLVLYGFNSAPQSEELLGKLGKHKLGAACVYINKLADVDMEVLRELARLGYEHMSSTDASFVPR